MIVNGVTLPDIPAEVLESGQNVCIVRLDAIPADGSESIVYHYLLASTGEFCAVPPGMTVDEEVHEFYHVAATAGVFMFFIVGDAEAWTEGGQASSFTVPIDTTQVLDDGTQITKLLYTNHNIYVASAYDDTTNLGTAGTEIYCTDSTKPTRYSIATTILDGNARQIMRLTGSTEKIVPETFEEKLKTVPYAPNCTQWTASNVEFPEGYFPCAFIDYGNGLFVGSFSYFDSSYNFTGMGLKYSEDGKTWQDSNITSGDYGQVKYCDGIWVALASIIGTGRTVLYSKDGKTWYQSDLTSNVRSIVHANGLIMAYSTYDGDGIYYSEDGKTWTQSLTVGCDTILNANGIWVASFYGGGKNGFAYSEDGKTWIDSNIASGFGYRIQYNGGIFVANTSNGLYWSEDGKTWNRSIDASFCHNKTYGNGVWVMGHNSGGVYYSEDGKTWTQSNITSGDYANSEVFYSDGIFLLSAEDGNDGIYYSTDGKVWTQSNQQTGIFYGFVQNSGVILGTDMSGGKLYYSTDGVNWKSSDFRGDSALGTIPVHGKNIWVAIETNVETMCGKLCYSVSWELPA